MMHELITGCTRGNHVTVDHFVKKKLYSYH